MSVNLDQNWEVVEVTALNGGKTHFVAPEGMTDESRAVCNLYHTNSFGRVEAIENSKELATLFAAAPDMLMALLIVATFYETAIKDEREPQIPDFVYRNAVAAIAKAKGEAV